MAIFYRRKNISLSKEDDEYINKKNLNLSKFLRTKLREYRIQEGDYDNGR